MKETGRTNTEQGVHEYTVISDLYDAHSRSKLWNDKSAPPYEVYMTRFIDTMLRIQTGDVQTVTMSYETDPEGNETIKLKLPIMNNFETTITKDLRDLEAMEPNVRELLPEECS